MKTTLHLSKYALICFGSILGVTSAHADLVTYQATGVISSAVSESSIDAWPAGFESASPGQVVLLTFTIDTSTPPLTPFPPGEAEYANALTAASVTFGPASYSMSSIGPQSNVHITADEYGAFGEQGYVTSYGVLGIPNLVTAGFSGLLETQFFVSQSTTSPSPLGLYASTSLSNGPLPVSDFPPSSSHPSTAFSLTFDLYSNATIVTDPSYYNFPAQTQIQGTLSSITTISDVPVPLPASAWLLLGAMGGLGGLARNRRKVSA